MAFVSLDLNPSRKMLRSFGFIGVAAFAALAAMVEYHVGAFKKIPPGAAEHVIRVFIGLAIYCGFFAAVYPRLLRPLYIILSVVAYPIGLVISYIIVTILFFLVITPLALVFRLIGRDALHCQFDRSAASYWVRRKPPADVQRYFRQF